MDILKEVQAIQDQLASERAALEAEREQVEKDKKSLKDQLKTVEAKREEATEKLAELHALEDKMDNFQMTQLEKDALLDLRRERAAQTVAMKEWENRLYEIEANQKTESERLTKLAAELAEKEASYREQIKNEFIEKLNQYIA